MKTTSVLGTAAVSHFELMRLHVHTCYVHDDEERLLRVNEPGGGSAPRFWLGLTSQGAIWRFGERFPDQLIEEFTRLCRAERAIGDPSSGPTHRASYERLMADSTGLVSVTTGPTYWLRSAAVRTSTTLALTSSDAALLRGTLDEWIPDLALRYPFHASREGSRAVAVCASVRMGDRADEAGVETAPAYRRRGHAVNAVSGWASAVVEMGKTPLYSTTWSNTASQAVARRVGFELFGAEYTIQ